MKRLVIIAGYAWFILTVVSLLVYAFAGVPLWSPMEPGDFRGLILTYFHMGGVVVGIVLLARGSDEKKKP